MRRKKEYAQIYHKYTGTRYTYIMASSSMQLEHRICLGKKLQLFSCPVALLRCFFFIFFIFTNFIRRHIFSRSLVVFDVLHAFSSTMLRCYFQYFPPILCELHSQSHDASNERYVLCCCRLQIFVCVIFLVDFLFCSVFFSVFILCVRVLLFVFSYSFFFGQHMCND